MISFVKQKIHNLVSDKKFSEILTGSVWALGARVISAVLGLATTVIVARWYGADVLGIVAVLQSFLMLATIFTVLGTNTSILHLIPEHSWLLVSETQPHKNGAFTQRISNYFNRLEESDPGPKQKTRW